MSTALAISSLSKKSVWTGRVISALVALFLLADSGAKFAKPAPVAETFAHLGIPIELANTLGVICIICTILYMIPRTAILGAVLLTGYFGGAVAIHLRIADPLFTHVLFPIYLGAITWLGLYLRDSRLRGMLGI